MSITRRTASPACWPPRPSRGPAAPGSKRTRATGHPFLGSIVEAEEVRDRLVCRFAAAVEVCIKGSLAFKIYSLAPHCLVKADDPAIMATHDEADDLNPIPSGPGR